MTHSFPILFDDNPPVDAVGVALVPRDSFTGAVVRNGVEAKLWDDSRDVALPYSAIRNLSGLLVFVNLPNAPQHKFLIDAEKAGYFAPAIVSFVPPLANDPRPPDEKLKLEVWLTRRPEVPFDEGTTLVRGLVVRSANPVDNAAVAIVRAVGGDPTFETRTDARGVFALALRLPPPLPGEAPTPVLTDIRVEEGADRRVLTRPLKDGRSHVFREAIDLTGTNEPTFGP